ncbi:AAA domain containing protein [uncultured Caudovirales phage]|uniref:AAA domain containing protein n=1 Tax=uncultured Caudovirales phage TaxID=2100421 RepID=A0A6J5NHM9_9CAUD|nr:AAA domain containing protein [uncultured Caudovirales phage]
MQVFRERAGSPASHPKDLDWDRAALRKVLYDILFREKRHSAAVEAVAKASPRHVDNGGKLKFRQTVSGILHAMTTEDLASVWYDALDAESRGHDVAARVAHELSGGWLGNVGIGWSSHVESSTRILSVIRAYAATKHWDTTPKTTTTTKKEAKMTNTTTQMDPVAAYNQLAPTMQQAINGMLSPLGLPSADKLVEAWAHTAKAEEAVAKAAGVIDTLKGELAKARQMPSGGGIQINIAPAIQSVQHAGWPTYTIEKRNARDIFKVPDNDAMQKAFDIELPYFQWTSRCADVPAIDDGYVFRPQQLRAVLMSLVQNTRTWLHGHTGTGKTTLIEQVCARLGWPVCVINLDSEISRLDLMGRDTLTTQGGVNTTQFVEGVLPRAMQRPMVLIFDEMDFGRSDVMYAVQRVLTGSSLTLTEDGGREILPDALFRMFATGNTRGAGDDHGMYQGARIQSAALLDRFTRWISVSYLDQTETGMLLKAKVPGLKDKQRELLTRYSTEHVRAFSERQIMTPLSPRGLLDLARLLETNLSMMPAPAATEDAFETVILGRLPDTDRAVLKAIVDRLVA